MGDAREAPTDAAARERELLRSVESAPWPRRWRVYLGLVGPGFLQSAMTLGGGTAVASLFAGAAFGYRLLWVAPVAMLLGCAMLSAVSWQTLSTGARPFEAMARHAGRPLAWAWAIGALVASIVWHFPQYALAGAVVSDLGDLAGLSGPSPAVAAFGVLAWAVATSFLYGRSGASRRRYERALKYMVWGIVLAFAWVVARTGVRDWGELLRGFFVPGLPEPRGELSAEMLVAAGLSAAVGVNMLFLYPYSLLARGWGRDHRRLARFDLGLGTFLPYVLAASLMTIAAANTLHPWDSTSLSPLQAARGLVDHVGPTTGRLVFNLGVLGMAMSSISLHMVCAGFVAVELFGVEVGSLRYRLATLLPTPGVLGPLLWKDLLWVAVPTTVLCGALLPLAYGGFVVLQRSEPYLGADRPRGAKGALWLSAMLAAIAVLVGYLLLFLWRKVFA
ncbi:MAG: divalent metal cation transporter [Planctomycetota bacterium]